MVPPPAPKGSLPKLELVYFPALGRGEAFRLICAAGGIPFEDTIMTLDQWQSKKKDSPFGGLPLLFIDDKKMISQHVAICRYAGKLAKLTGKHTLEDAQIDAVVDACNDWNGPLGKNTAPILLGDLDPLKEPFKEMMKKRGMPEQAYAQLHGNKEAWAGAWEDILKSITPTLERFEEKVSKNYNGWLIGDKMTWGDIYVAEFLHRLVQHCEPEPKKMTQLYPNLTKLVYKVYHGNPGIEEYRKTCPKYGF